MQSHSQQSPPSNPHSMVLRRAAQKPFAENPSKVSAHISNPADSIFWRFWGNRNVTYAPKIKGFPPN